MPYTYAGKLVRIDLTAGQSRVETIEDSMVERFLLGGGLAAKIFYDEMDPLREPLDPDSPLIFMIGVLSGTVIPTSARVCLCGRSPLTGVWNEATAGGYWAAQLRAAGYDGLVIAGRAPEPVYLWVNEQTVEIRPASHLWGLDTYQTAEKARKFIGYVPQHSQFDFNFPISTWEVVLMGSQLGQAITPEELGERIGTIPYEILCAVGKRVPRIYRG